MSTLDDAIQAIRMGDKDEGRQILEEMLEADEGNEQVWLWLCTVVDTNEDREVCLENVLALNPDNSIAQKALNDARSGRFNAHEFMSAAIGEMEEEEEPAPGASFIDEFRRASEDEEEDDDELVMPSTMAKSKGQKKPAAKKQGAGFKLNPRLIIMAVLVLLVICGLAGAAAYNLFLGGGGSSVEATVPVTPAGSGGEVQPTNTPVPAEATPAPPTDTPTATRPPLLLPTQKPTDLPTPTATQVVAPTP